MYCFLLYQFLFGDQRCLCAVHLHILLSRARTHRSLWSVTVRCHGHVRLGVTLVDNRIRHNRISHVRETVAHEQRRRNIYDVGLPYLSIIHCHSTSTAPQPVISRAQLERD